VLFADLQRLRLKEIIVIVLKGSMKDSSDLTDTIQQTPSLIAPRQGGEMSKEQSKALDSSETLKILLVEGSRLSAFH
jgi:hypothetical protein